MTQYRIVRVLLITIVSKICHIFDVHFSFQAGIMWEEDWIHLLIKMKKIPWNS